MAYQPKSYRKFVATAATATIVASALAPVASAATFTDVSDRYKEAVNYLVEQNITQGVTPTQFGVSQNIKRVDAAVMLAKALGLNTATAPASGFTDVPSRAEGAVNALKAAGVVNGKSATTFGADDNLTRGEVALILAKAYAITSVTKQLKFTDVSERYEQAVIALTENGITSGKSETKFGTADAITRGEFAVFVYKVETMETAPKVVAVTAVNGTVTATFNKAPETAPVAADFKVSQTINGGTQTTVTPTSFTWDVANKKATFAVPQVASTNAAQTVAYSVAFKDTAAQIGTFTVAAEASADLKHIGTDGTNNTITLFFDKPLDSSVARNAGNYIWDNNRNSGVNTPVFPSNVALNSAAVGAYGANQVVTLTYNNNAGDIVGGEEGVLTVQNLKNATGQSIPTVTRNVDVINGTDVTSPTVAVTLKSGSQQNAANVIVNTGESVELNAVTTDGNNGVVSLRYRLQNPDGSLTGWTNLNVADGTLGDKSETGKATITAGSTSGNYIVQVQAVDANQNVVTNTATSITVNSADIVGPQFANVTGTYNVTPSGSVQPRTVTVNATVTDAANRNNISKAEYRIQEFNPGTGAFDTVQDWTSVGAAVDGAFDETSEAIRFTTPQLATGKDYRIQLRATDTSNNTTSPAVSVAQANISGSAAAANGGGANAFNVPASESTVPAITATPVYGSASGSTVNDRAFTISGNATDNAGVGKIEYAIYKNADRDSSNTYETLVVPFTTTGVTVTDGQLGGTSENYTISGNLPAADGAYRVVTRVTDINGNVNNIGAAVAQYNLTLDETAPTATIAHDTTTTATDDFIITFSETMDVTAPTVDAGATSASALDVDNYKVVQNGVVLRAAQTVTQVGATNQFRVVFADELSAGQELRVVEVRDAVGNKINPNPTTFTIR
ncbi:hypothetical protein CVD28_09025 [Bacillus sp. M6-12]|uniref:S-layer homology domain-containing protein n=1 Tax=Bacillus sp. M6-12 TaxID=2054166 RepID=UPI000C777EA0|nr:S-layer homology domain-containing protein [Bacillus sp. M6-12]PLS17832.1 hypothetical protein CVD28_09025 [Bacillus sp. M6-12]